MRKLVWILMFTAIITLNGCSSTVLTEHKETQEEIKDEIDIAYMGRGDKWLATYTITKVKDSYYKSLYIQYIADINKITKNNGNQDIGPIEYELNGSTMVLSSSYPQELKGIGNFHTAIVTSSKLTSFRVDDVIELEVKWQDKSEKIVLKRIKNEY